MPEVKLDAPPRLTQKQKVLALMCQQPDKWFYPYEFMKPGLGAFYVGYKAPTRISEMHKSYPRLFEKKSEDKYMQRKLNTAEINNWYEQLEPRLKDMVDQFLQVGEVQ